MLSFPIKKLAPDITFLNLSINSNYFRISAGKENVIYHYVHLDVGTGMILSPPEIGMDAIVKNFRNACYLIHGVLQNTKK